MAEEEKCSEAALLFRYHQKIHIILRSASKTGIRASMVAVARQNIYELSSAGNLKRKL